MKICFSLCLLICLNAFSQKKVKKISFEFNDISSRKYDDLTICDSIIHHYTSYYLSENTLYFSNKAQEVTAKIGFFIKYIRENKNTFLCLQDPNFDFKETKGILKKLNAKKEFKALCELENMYDQFKNQFERDSIPTELIYNSKYYNEEVEIKYYINSDILYGFAEYHYETIFYNYYLKNKNNLITIPDYFAEYNDHHQIIYEGYQDKGKFYGIHNFYLPESKHYSTTKWRNHKPIKSKSYENDTLIRTRRNLNRITIECNFYSNGQKSKSVVTLQNRIIFKYWNQKGELTSKHIVKGSENFSCSQEDVNLSTEYKENSIKCQYPINNFKWIDVFLKNDKYVNSKGKEIKINYYYKSFYYHPNGKKSKKTIKASKNNKTTEKIWNEKGRLVGP